MKIVKQFIIIFLFLSSFFSFAQIGGVSGGKLATYNAETISKNLVEFEPSISYYGANKYWDNNGDLNLIYQTSDSAIRNTGMAFRFTYGLFENLEIGGSISSNLSATSLGLKYLIWKNNKMSIGAMAGANIPIGNQSIDKTARLSNLLTSYGLGAIYTYYFKDHFSIDFNASYMTFAKKTLDQHKGSWYFNADAGYYILKGKLQLIGGFGYQSAAYDGLISNVFTCYPGITIETGKSYIIVLQAPFDLLGKNSRKNAGFGFALTLAFN